MAALLEVLGMHDDGSLAFSPATVLALNDWNVGRAVEFAFAVGEQQLAQLAPPRAALVAAPSDRAGARAHGESSAADWAALRPHSGVVLSCGALPPCSCGVLLLNVLHCLRRARGAEPAPSLSAQRAVAAGGRAGGRGATSFHCGRWGVRRVHEWRD